MANRYWVSNGTWNATNTANWSTTSGGAGGASVPGSADIALFDANSGNCTLGANVSPGSINQTGYTRTLTGTGFTINLVGTGTVWTGATTCTNTNVSCNLTTNTASARFIVGGAVVEANAVNFSVSAGNGSVTAGGSMGSLDLTGFSGTLANAVRTIFGSLTIPSTTAIAAGTGTTTFSGNTGTRLITTNGVLLDFPLIIGVVTNGTGVWQLVDNLTVGTTRSITFTAGTLDINSKVLTVGQFLSSNSNARTLAFGTGSITVKGTSTVWSTATNSGLIISGTPVVNVDNNSSTAASVVTGALSESQSVSFNFISGSYALTFLATSPHSAKDVYFGSGFSGSWGTTALGAVIYGSLTLSASMTGTPSTANTMTFGATSGIKTITSNGKSLGFPMLLNGVGGTWQLQDALTLSSRTCTLTNGSLDLNGKTMTVGSFATGTGTKTLSLNSGILICTDSTATAFNNAQPTNLSLSAGTGIIQMSGSAAKTFVGAGQNYPCILVQAGAGTLTLSGANTFQDIQATSAGLPSVILLPALVTTTVSAFTINGTSGNLLSLNSSNGIDQASLLDLSGGIVNASYLDIANIYALPDNGTSWYSFFFNGNVNGGNNDGWVFENVSESYDFGPVASGPVAADPLVISIQGIQVADQSAAIGILNSPGLRVSDQSAAIAILVVPAPSSGRRRQYYTI